MAVIPRVDAADLQQTVAIVDAQGRPTPMFLRFINGAIRSLKTSVNAIVDAQNAADAANAAAAAAQAAADANTASTAIANSYIDNPAPITVTDAGASVTIAIAAHTRFYGDGTSVSVNAGNLTGRAYDTGYYIFYSDPARAGGAVTYQSSTDPLDAAQVGSTHSVGYAPPLSSGAPPAPGGGVRPPGGGYYDPIP